MNAPKITYIIYSFKIVLLTVITICSLNGCIGTPRSNSASSSSTNNEENNDGTNKPTFSISTNFFDNGIDDISSDFVININYKSELSLRGKEIDSTLRSRTTQDVDCFALYFRNSTEKKALILSAKQLNKNSLNSTKIKEYYYSLALSDKSINQGYCAQSAIINKVVDTWNIASTSIAYRMQDICTNCNISNLKSSANLLMNATSTAISGINTNYLTLTISYTSQTDDTTYKCTGDTECIAKGLDCCSNNICGDHAAALSGVNLTSVDYLNAKNIITDNPSEIINYPQYFHICKNLIPGNNNDDDEEDEEDPNITLLKTKEDLYYCTTLIRGEMSLCTLRVKSPVSTSTYSTAAADKSFFDTYSGQAPTLAASYLPLPNHSIYMVKFDSDIVFSDKKFQTTPNAFTISNRNDNPHDKAALSGFTFSSSTKELVIRYKVDGSCVEKSSTTALCTKYYTQGQNIGELDDHYPATNSFKLPAYADITKTINVTVNDLKKEKNTHWTLSSAARTIDFVSSTTISDGESVKITYYVNTNSYPVLDDVKTARSALAAMCGTDKKLVPVPSPTNANSIIDYECKPINVVNNDLPQDMVKVSLSTKRAPHRFFNSSGAYVKNPTASDTQEGSTFQYVLIPGTSYYKPNSYDTYVGFNEIYGSFTGQNDSALPALEVPVVNGDTYDIITAPLSGSVRTCPECGNDYYSAATPLFPRIGSTIPGVGVTPDGTTTNPFSLNSNNVDGTIRKDDLLFGRACFVPATMIPWTHRARTALQEQREYRLSAQHALYANGYTRDWYGFNYGSIIGSFDGVKWFAVGDGRKIKATSSKLFLSINAPFLDLAQLDTFNVTVTNAKFSQSSNLPTTDYDNKAASCQKYYQCEKDSDCAAQLGWDYACSRVDQMYTSWPNFDANGSEVANSSKNARLVDLFGSSTGGTKRCVYRGRGAPCLQNYNITDATLSYANTTTTTINSCNPNYYCQTINSTNNYFNTSLSRFRKPLITTNSALNALFNTFGLDAPLATRPLNYVGDDTIPTNAISQLSSNKVSSICLPGKNSAQTTVTILQSHKNRPGTNDTGDRVNAIGVTEDSDRSNSQVSRCPTFDSDGNFIHNKSTMYTKQVSNSDVVTLASSQNISTRALKIFEGLTSNTVNITSNFLSSQITTPVLEENRCLKTPGSTCFSDMDCAPSKFIFDKLGTIDPDNASQTNYLNKFEIKYWKENLICSQDVDKTSSSYKLSNNRCCRETNQTITIPTHPTYVEGGPDADFYDYQNIPGGSALSISSKRRYSRFLPVINSLLSGTLESYMKVAERENCLSRSSGDCEELKTVLNKQYRTLSAVAERTCCSTNWVRNFHKDNGGGHSWGPTKLQAMSPTIFRCLNWLPCNLDLADATQNTCGGNAPYFSCAHTPSDPTDPRCLIKETLKSEAAQVFSILETLDLTGIPQIPVKAWNSASNNVADNTSPLECLTDPDDQTAVGTGIVLPGTIKAPETASITSTDYINHEYIDRDSDNIFYSANNLEHFDTNTIKKVFSEDEFSCCLPAGSEVPNAATASTSICCTGYINPENNRCALPNYSDVSVYFNRFVSSEAKGIDENAFDPQTGYFKSTGSLSINPLLVTLACEKNVCRSKKMMTGVALSKMRINGINQGAENNLISRYVESEGSSSADGAMSTYFANGIKWNNHLYCAPSDIDSAVSSNNGNITVINCN